MSFGDGIDWEGILDEPEDLASAYEDLIPDDEPYDSYDPYYDDSQPTREDFCTPHIEIKYKSKNLQVEFYSGDFPYIPENVQKNTGDAPIISVPATVKMTGKQLDSLFAGHVIEIVEKDTENVLEYVGHKILTLNGKDYMIVPVYKAVYPKKNGFLSGDSAYITPVLCENQIRFRFDDFSRTAYKGLESFPLSPDEIFSLIIKGYAEHGQSRIQLKITSDSSLPYAVSVSEQDSSSDAEIPEELINSDYLPF